MDIHYRCSFADYKEAHEAQFRKPSAIPVLLFGAMLFTALAIFRLLHGQPLQGFIRGLVAVAALMPILLRMYQRWSMGHSFREARFGGDGRMMCNDQGVEIEDEMEHQEIKWGAFTRFQETDNLFILHKGGGRVQVIPKRCFTENQVDEFRTVLTKNVRTVSQATIMN